MNENLYDYIFKRKSNRKYNMTPLETNQLEEIKAFADNLKPLYENIMVKYELACDVKNILPVKAPHYFLISSETKDGYLVNVGFLFQQMDLFLSSKGLGSCWLGMARPTGKMDTNLEFVIAIAFGKTIASPYRNLSEFKRKLLSDISTGSDDRLECAHIAPSASNSQNWFYVCENDKINIYKKNLNTVQSLLYGKMNDVDIGIAICHLCLATEHQGKVFTFSKNIIRSKGRMVSKGPNVSQESIVNDLKGFTYVGTVN